MQFPAGCRLAGKARRFQRRKSDMCQNMDEELDPELSRDSEAAVDAGSATPVAGGHEQSTFDADPDTANEAIIAALRTVQDPEIPVNIYDLGLIYRIGLGDHGFVEIDMTLTAPGCPVAGEMLGWVEKAVRAVDGVGSVKVNLVFDPPWDKSRMSEEVKLELGLI
jgi:FeS assembly SUF system protein